MKLHKEDVEKIVSETKHPTEINHIFSNYWENLDEPCTVAIPVCTQEDKNKTNPQIINQVVSTLRKNGIDAVSMFDEEAIRTDKFVVNDTGILTPFMSPQEALKATAFICDTCLEAGLEIGGHSNLLTNDSLLYTANSIPGNFWDKTLNVAETSQHSQKYKEILERRGNISDFINQMVSEAKSNSQTINEVEDYRDNLKNGYNHIWRGATSGGKPFGVISKNNNRKVAYGTPNLTVASVYTGCLESMSGKGGATYQTTSDGYNYGFLYEYQSMGDEQVYYPDSGLQKAENGIAGGTKEDYEQKGIAVYNSDYETPILPHRNKLQAIYLHVGRKGLNGEEIGTTYDRGIDQVYKIEIDENGKAVDPRWQDFLDLHEPYDASVYGFLAERQDNQKKEQDANPLNHHDFNIKKTDEKSFAIEKPQNFAKAVSYRGNFHSDEDGTTINQNVLYVGDLSKADLKQITINGNFSLIGTMSVLNLPKVLNTPMLLTMQDITNFEPSSDKIFSKSSDVRLIDVDKISMMVFLKITKGSSWIKKNVFQDENGKTVIKNLNLSQGAHFSVNEYPKDIGDYHFICDDVNNQENKTTSDEWNKAAAVAREGNPETEKLTSPKNSIFNFLSELSQKGENDPRNPLKKTNETPRKTLTRPILPNRQPDI